VENDDAQRFAKSNANLLANLLAWLAFLAYLPAKAGGLWAGRLILQAKRPRWFHMFAEAQALRRLDLGF
jgi:hypothetical protein